MKPIDGDALIAWIKESQHMTSKMKNVICKIETMPSIDRPQGEWIYCEDENGIDGYRCSLCGRHIPWDYQHKFINFIEDYHTCPFCDARMKGADDE